MMSIRHNWLVAALLGSIALIASGCDQRHPAETAGKKIDRAAEEVAAKTNEAADRAAKAVDDTARSAGQKMDRAAEDVTAKTNEAADRAAKALDDTALTAKVKAALFAEPGLKTLQIEVETHDAVVTLAGSVDSPTLRTRATEIAGSLTGVRQVVDKLVVKS